MAFSNLQRYNVTVLVTVLFAVLAYGSNNRRRKKNLNFFSHTDVNTFVRPNCLTRNFENKYE